MSSSSPASAGRGASAAARPRPRVTPAPLAQATPVPPPPVPPPSVRRRRRRPRPSRRRGAHRRAHGRPHARAAAGGDTRRPAHADAARDPDADARPVATRPTPTPPPAATGPSPAQQAAAQAQSLAEQAEHGARRAPVRRGARPRGRGAAASTRRTRGPRGTCATPCAGATSRGGASSPGQTAVQTQKAEKGGGLAGFDTGDADLRKAPDFQGRIEFEMAPPSGIEAGARGRCASTSSTTARSRSTSRASRSRTTVNGAGGGGPVPPQAKDIAPQQRALVGETTGTWRDGHDRLVDRGHRHREQGRQPPQHAHLALASASRHASARRPASCGAWFCYRGRPKRDAPCQRCCPSRRAQADSKPGMRICHCGHGTRTPACGRWSPHLSS